MWRTFKPLVVPRGIPQAYKYAIFEGGHFKRWEALEIPRVICVDDFHVELSDVLDEPAEADDAHAPLTPSAIAKREAINRIRRTLSQTVELTEDAASLDARKLLETSTKEHSPPPGSHLYLVCFHLPVTIAKDAGGAWTAEWNESLIAKTDHSISSDMLTFWVGTVSASDLSEADKQEIRALLEPMRCHPIFMPREMIEGHYHGYCKKVMWPLFHNVEMLDSCGADWNYKADGRAWDPASVWAVGGKEHWWGTYCQVNRIFRDVVVEVCKLEEGDVLWVHDYHLMLLPSLVSAHEERVHRHRKCSIIFFLHIPFPTSQIFRALYCGEDLLKGMLSADVIGFHAFDHARHFLNACKRILGLSYFNKSGGLIGIELETRTVTVLISHVGIEGSLLTKAMATARVQEETAALRHKHKGKLLIAGLDISQRLSGIALKLLAFERLLTEYECYRDRVVMVQRSLLTGSRAEDEEATTAEVRELVARVNAKFGPVIDYQELRSNRLPREDRIALWLASDVLVIAAIREGLNLHPLEFTFVKQGEEHPPGVVLASEFSACSSLLNGALRINPFDIKRVVVSLDHAIRLELQERLSRRDRDLPYISERPSSLWTRQVLQDLWAAKAETPELLKRDTGGVRVQYQPVWQTSHNHLRETEVEGAYSKATRRFIFTDFGGTLMEKEKVDLYIKRSFTQTTGKRPSPSVMESLRLLSADPKNEVFIISGLQLLPLEEVFGHLDRIGLAAANGLYLSMPQESDADKESLSTTPRSVPPGSHPEDASGLPQQHKGKKRSWSLLDYGVKWAEVKDIALPILERYTARTNGSSVRLRDPGIAWSYYSTDPEWGLMQAKSVIAELEEALAAHDVKVVHLKGMVEIVPKRLNKGVVLRYAIQSKEGPSPDFIMCMGDDASDEYMFTSLYSYLSETAETELARSHKAYDVAAAAAADGSEPVQGLSQRRPSQQAEEEITKYVFTCSVGKHRSHASFYVHNVEEVRKLLEGLAALSS